MKTGVQGTFNWWKELDSGFRRNDGTPFFLTFYEFIRFILHSPRAVKNGRDMAVGYGSRLAGFRRPLFYVSRARVKI